MTLSWNEILSTEILPLPLPVNESAFSSENPTNSSTLFFVLKLVWTLINKFAKFS